MFDLIARVLDQIGPRESCSADERRLGQLLAEQWGADCDEVRTEAFDCHPHAFLGVIPITAVAYLLALAVWHAVPWLAATLGALAGALVIFEVLGYRELADPLFPKRTGHNVIGVIRPSSEVRRRVIVSAHQDSAYEFNLWYWFKSASILVNVIGFGAFVLPLIGGISGAIEPGAGAHAGLWTAALVCGPVVALNLVFHTFNVVPGAMDDLAGVSVMCGVARALSDADAEGGGLAHTEVVLLAASSEEAGLRGSKRFVARHDAELRAVPTYGIFVDGVYDERFLTVIRGELSTLARHDPRLVSLACQVASDRGWPMARKVIPMGATDASAFTMKGIPAVGLLCQDISKLVPNYHTRLDTLEHVRPESLVVMLQVVMDMIVRLDTGALESNQRR